MSVLHRRGSCAPSFQGYVRWGTCGLLHTFEPQSPPCPPQGSVGGDTEEQAGRKCKEIILCLLAHLHIKSNSFIFTFVHPAGPEKGWLGRGRGLLKDSCGRGLSGDVPLRQGPMPRDPLSRLQVPGPEVLASRPCWPGSGGCHGPPCRVWHTLGW